MLHDVHPAAAAHTGPRHAEWPRRAGLSASGSLPAGDAAERGVQQPGRHPQDAGEEAGRAYGLEQSLFPTPRTNVCSLSDKTSGRSTVLRGVLQASS